MKILITGSNGQLGHELQALFAGEQFEVLAYDREEMDIVNKEAVMVTLIKEKPSIVISCAAYTAVDKAETEEQLAYNINATGAQNLALACKEIRAKLIHISTDFVFDGNTSIPYKEEDKSNPLSVYGKSKLAGEKAIFDTLPSSVVIRTSWLYSSFGANFVKTITRLCKERDSLNIIADQIGSPTYAKDLAVAIKHICLSDKLASSHGIFHFANQGVASWYDFAVNIALMQNLTTTISPIQTFEYPTPAERPKYSVLNTTKIKSTFNLTIPHWQQSLEACIQLLNK